MSEWLLSHFRSLQVTASKTVNDISAADLQHPLMWYKSKGITFMEEKFGAFFSPVVGEKINNCWKKAKILFSLSLTSCGSPQELDLKLKNAQKLSLPFSCTHMHSTPQDIFQTPAAEPCLKQIQRQTAEHRPQSLSALTVFPLEAELTRKALANQEWMRSHYLIQAETDSEVLLHACSSHFYFKWLF